MFRNDMERMTVDWTYVAQERDNLQVLLNKKRRIRFPKHQGVSWLAKQLLASEE